jgi:hypothetical protein
MLRKGVQFLHGDEQAQYGIILQFSLLFLKMISLARAARFVYNQA